MPQYQQTSQQYCVRFSLLSFIVLFFILNCSFFPASFDPLLSPIPSSDSRSAKKQHQSLLRLLHEFHRQAEIHTIPYRIEFGSLLGYMQSRNIIEHDRDVDLLIDVTSLAKLDYLTYSKRFPWFIDQRYHPPLPPFNITNATNTNTNNSNHYSTFLYRSTNHEKDFANVKRIDCFGKPTNNMKDSCSFSGPIGRAIDFDINSRKPISYIDVYISGCSYHRPYGKYKSWHCRKRTNTCSFCPSSEARRNSLLDQSGGKLKKCYLSGIETYCPRSSRWTMKYLEKIYGPTWRTPNKKWKYSDRPSKRRL
jgi:hypothetical protein